MRRRKAPGTVQASGEPIQASGEPIQEETHEEPPRPGEKPKKEAPPFPVGWGNVVNDTLRITDPAGLARRLREELTLGEDRSSYGQVLLALDKSASNLDSASRLYRSAKIEEDKYVLKVEDRLEALRSKAKEELNFEWKNKQRSAPTIKDVEDRMLRDWPGEYTAIKTKLSEVHNAVRALETLRDAWSSRCADLRLMADKARKDF